MSVAHSHDNMIPPRAVGLAVALVVAILLLVVLARIGLAPTSASPAELRAERQMRAVAERTLLFADDRGFVRVTDAGTGATVALLGQDGSGFIRGVMRGLARERRMHGLGAAQPFRLTLYADGQLALTDTATGRVIELNGFGATNRDAFLNLLKVRP